MKRSFVDRNMNNILAEAVALLLVLCKGISAVNMTGCLYQDHYPYVIDGSKQPKGDIKSPGFDEEGEYPDNAYCAYIITAPAGHIVKLTFKEMEFEAGSRCSKDKIFLVDGDTERGADLGAFCGLGPPPFPIVSTKNGMYIMLRTNHMIRRKGFHAHYEIIRPEELCPSGYQKCRNNNCYNQNQKCDGQDDCLDGTDEEDCKRPLEQIPCGSGTILPLEPPYAPDRIVGGIEARPGSWPWQADLQSKGFFPEGHICGGTLLNAEWVMTAQHCLMGMSYAENWKVVVGNHDRFRTDPDEQVRYVKRIVMYPGYTGEEIIGKNVDITNDIALMKLNAPVKFTERVRPACLPKEAYNMLIGTECIASGWGETRGSGHDEVLKQAVLSTKHPRFCASFTNETMICVKSDNFQDACHGDSGGPLNCKIEDKWNVMGITSFGSAHNMMSGLCAVSKMGTVFNKVSAKISWINNMILQFS